MGTAVAIGFRQGWLKPIIGTRYKLEDVMNAHEDVIAHRNGSHGKIIINIV